VDKLCPKQSTVEFGTQATKIHFELSHKPNGCAGEDCLTDLKANEEKRLPLECEVGEQGPNRTCMNTEF